MTTLAPKLPYSHPFAGGYPRIGGQPLPTDPDAIDYLSRVAAADGAAVEVGVAMAVDAFVKGCKADGIWDALKASCIMCGARTISGALVPLAGAAPTPYNFASGDYSRTTGLKGDGITKYLDSNRADNADGQNDHHMSSYISSVATGVFSGVLGAYQGPTSISTQITKDASGFFFTRSRSSALDNASTLANGFAGISRSSATEYTKRNDGVSNAISAESGIPGSYKIFAFAYSVPTAAGYSNARLAFYSIGSALDLAALDTRVSTLVSAIAAAI